MNIIIHPKTAKGSTIINVLFVLVLAAAVAFAYLCYNKSEEWQTAYHTVFTKGGEVRLDHYAIADAIDAQIPFAQQEKIKELTQKFADATKAAKERMSAEIEQEKQKAAAAIEQANAAAKAEFETQMAAANAEQTIKLEAEEAAKSAAEKKVETLTAEASAVEERHKKVLELIQGKVTEMEARLDNLTKLAEGHTAEMISKDRELAAAKQSEGDVRKLWEADKAKLKEAQAQLLATSQVQKASPEAQALWDSFITGVVLPDGRKFMLVRDATTGGHKLTME
ncbi:MAG: hypothetical protein V4469_04755 [Patescibacteria group bacterium]